MKTTLKTAEGAYSFTPFRIHEQQLDSLKSQILRVNRVNHLKYFIFKTVNVDRKDKWKGPSKPEFKRLPSPDPYYQSSSERDPNKRDWQKSTYSTKSPPEPFNLEVCATSLACWSAMILEIDSHNLRSYLNASSSAVHIV